MKNILMIFWNNNFIMIYILLIMLTFSIINSQIHPIIYMMNFIMYTFIMMYFIYMNTYKSLYLLLIMISIIGGILIMFNYFLSLINNEKSKMNYMNTWLLWYFLLSMMFLFFFNYYSENKNMIMIHWPNLMNQNILIYKIYIYPMYYMTILMILMLLMMLIMSFKMCTFKYLPLRKMSK
uniref:NADH dehydrogenase subunit 6 n=1 Tax=Megachile sculpturalis TaxID=1004196 RepID=A0A0M5KLY0_9HYME|nr:NADH dehydrogenase subunit 6 [Megachile sculpturalis]